MEKDPSDSDQMWLVSLQNPKELVEFWYLTYRQFGGSWHQLRQRLGHSPCQLFAKGDGYVALVTTPSGSTPEDVFSLLSFAGAMRVNELPAGLTVADLSEFLTHLKLSPGDPPTKIPRFAVFTLSQQSGINDFVRWLMKFSYDDMQFAVQEVNGQPTAWLAGVEHLGSRTPFEQLFRDRQLAGTRVFIPIDQRSTLAHPQGFYVEWGCVPQCGDAFKDLWADYGGVVRQHLILRGAQGLLIDAAGVHFAPVPDVAELVLDTNLARLDFRPARASGQLGPLELRIEAKPLRKRLHSRLAWRRIKDQIDYLKAELDRLELKDLEDAPEPLVLMWIPQSREAALHDVLRRTPEEVLQNFVYLYGRIDGQRSHFIYPAASAVHRTFPDVSGTNYLYCDEEWRQRGLHLFMAPELWLMPHLHFSNASKLRQTLLNGALEDGLGPSPLFVFWQDDRSRMCQCILPDPRTGFIPLPQALEYTNGCRLADIKMKLVDDTVRDFCLALSERLEEGREFFKQEASSFSATADTFFVTAVGRLDQSLSDLERIRTAIVDLENKIQEEQKACRAIDEEVNTLTSKDRQRLEQIQLELDALRSQIANLLKGR